MNWKYIRMMALFTSFIIVMTNVVFLIVMPDLHCYPAVTRCRLCGDRVWTWQSYERRDYKVKADNPEHLSMTVEMSGLVHCDCEGTPEATAKITSKGVSTPVLGAKEIMGITVPQ
jgi:hypothetical protein